MPETSAFKLGKYKLTVWVKRAGTEGINAEGYDSYYTAALNCVSRDNANRVYASGDAKVETNSLTVKVKGIENIDGIKGPYLYRLFIFNPTTGAWTNGAYEVWKIIIVTVKDDGTVKVLDTTVAPATFGSTVNVTLTAEGGAIFATAVKYQIFDGTKALSDMAKLGTGITISEAKSSGDKVIVKLFDASGKEVKDMEAFLGTPVAIPEFKYAVQAEVDSMGSKSGFIINPLNLHPRGDFISEKEGITGWIPSFLYL